MITYMKKKIYSKRLTRKTIGLYYEPQYAFRIQYDLMDGYTVEGFTSNGKNKLIRALNNNLYSFPKHLV